MKSLVIIANWKCNPKTLAQAKQLFSSVKKGLPKKLKAKPVICPPFVYLSELAKDLGKLKLGAQDGFWQEGAFTSQVSLGMLRKLGCSYVLIGHSEKRALGETDKIVNKKLKACVKTRLTPIICIGESLKQRKSNKTAQVLKNQIQKGFKGIPAKEAKKIIIVYEPIWAISNGDACQPEEAMVMQLLIRKYLRELYSKEFAKKIKIIYGGSVNSQNASSYIKEANMDGLLVGAASLKPKKFLAILKKFC